MMRGGVVRKIGMDHQNPTIVRNHQDLRNAIIISPNQLEKSRLPRNGQDHNHQTKKSKTNENTLLLIPPVRNCLHDIVIKNEGRRRIEENRHLAVAVATNQPKHLMHQFQTVTSQKMKMTLMAANLKSSLSSMILSSIWITLCTFQCMTR